MSYVARKVWSARWHNLIAFFEKCNEGYNLLACLFCCKKRASYFTRSFIFYSCRIDATILKKLSFIGKGKLFGGT